MGHSVDEQVKRLEDLGPVLLRGLQLIGSSTPFGSELSFSQYYILQTLLDKEAMQMNELALALGVSKANITGLVDRMVRARLLERMRSDEDRRVVFVTLSPKGRRVAQRLQNAQRRDWKRIMETLPVQNLEIFMDSLEQLSKALAERPREKVIADVD
ncbi:MarR family transcriptional regulator [bacterium]|nr:MarR family transcriptional regulator [bacterium]